MAIANITGNILTDSGVATSSLLPLTGGTLTGNLTIAKADTLNVLTLSSTNTNVISFITSSVQKGEISVNASNFQFNSATTNGYIFKNSAANNVLTITDAGVTTLTGALSGTSATFSTEVTSSGSQGRFGGWSTGAGYQGAALEVGVSGGTATLIGYNRTSGAYIPLTIGGNTNQTTTIGGNTIVLQNNGVTALTIFSTGNATFSNSVITNGNFAAFNGGSIEVYNTGTTNFFELKSTGGNFALRTNVGATPVNALTIASTGAATFSGSVQIQSSNGIKLNRSANDYYWQINSDSSNYLNFGAYLANGTAYGTNPKMILLDNGNVGIGTSSPSEKLDVIGGALAAGNGTIRTGITYSSLGLIGTFTNHDLGVITNGTERMRITSGGNVLIATTTDNGQGKLQVNGAITANNISYTGELVTNSTTFNATYYHIISGAASSGQTYTLPSPSSNNLQYVIINKSPFSQTISAGSGFTIYNMAGSDVASITLASKARCFIIADGSGFYQIF